MVLSDQLTQSYFGNPRTGNPRTGEDEPGGVGTWGRNLGRNLGRVGTWDSTLKHLLTGSELGGRNLGQYTQTPFDRRRELDVGLGTWDSTLKHLFVGTWDSTLKHLLTDVGNLVNSGRGTPGEPSIQSWNERARNLENLPSVPELSVPVSQ
jgi:hypothetical protein